MRETITLHRASSRGHGDHGWLKSFHTFSFGSYYEPSRTNFGALRVLNDDRILGGTGFHTHTHRDMEIISVPLEGSLRHEDSQGNRHVLVPGDVQVMSAGTGIAHSEFNASATEPAAFLQIWVIPKNMGTPPRYDQKHFGSSLNDVGGTVIVSPDGRKGSLRIGQDALFTLARISKGERTPYRRSSKENGVYFFLVQGELTVASLVLSSRDGLGIKSTDEVELSASSDSQLLIMDIPMNVPGI